MITSNPEEVLKLPERRADDFHMRCTDCDANRVEITMAGRDGRRLSMVTCCAPQWFCDGHPIAAADLGAYVPGRCSRGRKPVFVAA